MKPVYQDFALRLESINVRTTKTDIFYHQIELYIKLFAILYADDTILLSDDENHFQNLLYYFAEYCKRWHLRINISKTKIMIFGGNVQSNNEIFTLNGSVVEIVKEFKYLGILFTQNGRFVQNTKKLADIACKSMHLLRRRIVNLNLPIDCQLKLFDQTVVPILLYGCEIFGFENIYAIEKIHLQFLKSIFKLKKSTPNVMVYGEFGRYPLEILVKIRMVKFWFKLLSGKNTKIACTMYKLLYYLFKEDIYKSKWILKIQNILQEVGLNYIWLDNDVQNIDHLCNTINTRLQSQFVQNWNQKIFDTSKCLNYRIFKTIFTLEKYVTEMPLKSAITLAKFRTTNNKLPIEKGRWDNTNRNLRICNLCNKNALGDEYHVLFECDFFATQRRLFLPRYYWNHCNSLKFSSLLSTNNTKLLKKLSDFVAIVLRMFK